MATDALDLRDLRLERPAPGVARLVLDNPEQRNAMSDAMTASWARAIDHLAGDPDLRVVVVTGEGSAFCAGGDHDWLVADPGASVDQLRAKMVAFYRTWLAIRRLEVPTIAALNGPAVGAGLSVALACDIRYAAASAKVSVPFTRLGLHPGMATTFLLPDVVGPAAARDLLLTGRAIDAAEALRIGLVSAVFDGADFAAQIDRIAGDVAAAAPIASRYTKIALREGGHRNLEDAIQWEALAQPITLATADLHEGVRAAREKRRPEFRGE